VPTSEPAPLPGVVGADGRDGPSPLLPLSAGRVGRLGAWGSAIARGTVRQHGALCKSSGVSGVSPVQRRRSKGFTKIAQWQHCAGVMCRCGQNTVHVPHFRHPLAAVLNAVHLC
jgi:hypothetical protein